MTGLLVGLGISGNPQMAADVAIVQGAALALFFAFSGNARNLILKPGGIASVRSIMVARLILILPLGMGVYYLGSILGGVAWNISLILILRKSVEWISEIHLSEAERDQDVSFAWKHLAVQFGLLATIVIWAFTQTPGILLILIAWALIPLLISLPYLQKVLRGAASTRVSVKMLLPHFGSTAVVGIGVYVFRLMILLLVGRSIAGILYTAFAIGGVLGSIFAMGLGPSMVLHEQKTGKMQMPLWLRTTLTFTTITGIAIAAAAHVIPDFFTQSGKDTLFWKALGLSLLGGVVMVFAQRQRLRDLQHGTQDDVFAPDVLVNMLIVIFIPAIYFSFGKSGMTWLYLFNAMTALVFYWMTDINRAAKIVDNRHMNKLRAVLATLIVLPVFMNLESGLFRDATLTYTSGGLFSKLPIPLSVFGCYVGIALLGNYRRANLGLMIIFGSFVLMVLSTVATTFASRSEEQAKLILLMQYILPMFGLVLGMMYEGTKRNEYVLEKAMLAVIAALIPVQLMASWMQHQLVLTPYLYIFSIYQHLQYVPIVVTSCYLMALFGLWNIPSWGRLSIVLSPLIGIYIAASGSILAAGFLLLGTLIFALPRREIDKGTERTSNKWIVLSLVLVAGTTYYILASRLSQFEGQLVDAGAVRMDSLRSILHTWLYYLNGIFSEPLTFMFGHSAPPDRQVWPSAHNYYLDFIYNYGTIGALMIIGLIAFTLIRINQNRKIILTSPVILGLMIVVMFLLFPDNLMQVSMRQPYPGIFAFFLWGLFLARVESMWRSHPN